MSQYMPQHATTKYFASLCATTYATMCENRMLATTLCHSTCHDKHKWIHMSMKYLILRFSERAYSILSNTK